MPLALAMLNVSNPSIAAMDSLSRLTHDQDHEVAHNAVIALGMFATPLFIPTLLRFHNIIFGLVFGVQSLDFKVHEADLASVGTWLIVCGHLVDY